MPKNALAVAWRCFRDTPHSSALHAVKKRLCAVANAGKAVQTMSAVTATSMVPETVFFNIEGS